jgi:secreted PhoX family phosphatase
MPAFKPDASNTADEQAAQAGMHHDGMAWFSLPQGSKTGAWPAGNEP